MNAPLVQLHIGAMKTGTTYIQRLLGQNRERLEAAEVLYPAPWSDQVEAVRDVLELKGGSHLGSLEGSWRAMVDRLHTWSGTQAVLSVEFLSFANDDQVRRMVADLQPSPVKVIVGARDLGRSLPAQWQTAVRNGRTTSYRDYLDGATSKTPSPAKRHFWKRQDIGKIARRWADVVGQNNVTVVTIPPKGTDPDILRQRITTALQLDLAETRASTSSNESLGPTATELLRRINIETEAKQMPTWIYQHAINRALSHAVLPSVPDPHPSLVVPADFHPWLRRHSTRITDELQSSGVNVVGDLDDLDPHLDANTASDGSAFPEDISSQDLLTMAVAALAGYTQNVGAEMMDDARSNGPKRRRRRGEGQPAAMANPAEDEQ